MRVGAPHTKTTKYIMMINIFDEELSSEPLEKKCHFPAAWEANSPVFTAELARIQANLGVGGQFPYTLLLRRSRQILNMDESSKS